MRKHNGKQLYGIQKAITTLVTVLATNRKKGEAHTRGYASDTPRSNPVTDRFNAYNPI